MKRIIFCAFAALALASGCAKKPKPWPAVPSAAPPAPDKEFNVVWSTTDLNGLPHNPRWGLQASANVEPPAPSPTECIREPYQPSCTVQPVLQDRPDFPNSLICVPFIPESHVHGHVDWMPAEFTGLGAWLNFADDWDYNLILFPTNDLGLEINNGYTANNNSSGNSKYMEVEFASEETVDRFVTPWWSNFRSVVRSLEKKRTEHELYPANDETLPRAVVVGLFGLDCEHDCRSELHPVYALAIEISDDPADNTWAIFVRNWGTGGFCSSLNHEMQISGDMLRILLPRKSHGTVEVNTPATQFAGTSGLSFPEVAQIVGKGTVLTFHLSDASQRPTVEMLLHLKWTNDDVKSGPRLATMTYSQVLSRLPKREREAEEQSSEAYLGSLLQARTNSRLSTAPLRLAPAFAASQLQIQTVPQIKVERYEAPTSQAPATLPSVKNKTDDVKLARDTAKLLAVCAAYNDNPPTDRLRNFPDICHQVRAGH